jgi:hypothetical protein
MDQVRDEAIDIYREAMNINAAGDEAAARGRGQYWLLNRDFFDAHGSYGRSDPVLTVE